jgi:hypothetical protein
LKNKQKDVLYSNVSEENIKSRAPIFDEKNLSLLFHWIEERYKIHKKKDVLKLDSPWTDDKILQDYRFTNVRREHDRETKWYIEHIAKNSSLSIEDKIYNTFLFRAWNKSKTMEILGGPWNYPDFMDKERYRSVVERYSTDHPEYVWYTAAFNCGGLKSSQKFPDGEGYARAHKEEKAKMEKDWEQCIPIRMFHIPPQMEKKDIVNRILNSKDQPECFNIIQEVRGFSTFLAYQVFVDLTYIEDFPFSENEFTVCGPGCRRGIDEVVKDRNGLSYEEIIFWIRDNQKSLFERFNIDPIELFDDLTIYDRCLNVMSLESSFCEISKYLKAYYETGRPRVRYRSSEDSTKKLF